MNATARNLRIAFRQLRKTPGFTLTVVLTLALGIGAATAIFSLVQGILLRPLPFQQPARLVLLGDHLGDTDDSPAVAAPEIANYSAAASAFSSMGAYISSDYELSNGPGTLSQPEQVHAARFTASLFPTLGIQPILGRVFSTQEDNAHQPLAVISYALWLSRYHREPQVLGSSILLDRRPYTIIGVMPRTFEFPLESGFDQARLWVPMSLTAAELEPDSGLWGYSIVARLNPGVTLPQAAQDADRVARQVMRTFPSGKSGLHIRGDVEALHESAVADVQPTLRAFFLSVSVVLLIACVNVAGLLLVRAIRRRREFAIRLALGARSSAILRESIMEGLLLSFTGGIIGLAFAAAAIRITLHQLPDSMPRIDSVAIDGPVVAFALLLAIATGVLCSLAPAWAALRTNLLTSLKSGAQTGSGTSTHSWLRSSLVVSEIAIALILLTVAGAFLRSLQHMRSVNPGFRPDHVLVANYRLPASQYPTNLTVHTFNRAIIDRLSGKPGVSAVAITSILPGEGWGGSAFTIEGQPAATWKLKFAMFASVTGDYFHAMGIPLLQGRVFSANDRANTPAVIIVNESMARHSWPGQNALGKRMHVGNPKKNYPWATVIGIVADTKRGARDEPDFDQWYNPADQPETLFGPSSSSERTDRGEGYITLRSALPPQQMVQTLRATVAEIDPLLALEHVQPMTDVLSDVEAPRRFNTSLITAFAVSALLLAITGIYAVVAFSVSLRRHELAIRMALGAPRTGIARLVLISGLRTALIGCALGLAGAFAVSRLVTSFLFEVSPTDPLIYLGAALTMIVMALLASALPATRAASTDPILALRST